MTTPIILYVDDERANLVVFKHTFSSRFALRTVSSPKEALELMATTDVAVLVTDQRMPEMSGNELLATVKELYPLTTRIIITAYSDLDAILGAVNEGLVARYVVKPWNPDELGEILKWALEAYEATRRDSAIQLRLLQTERLVTLGSIAAAVFHDVRQPLSYLQSNTQRLEQLLPRQGLFEFLCESPANTLDEKERRHLHELFEELPEIVHDMSEGCTLMAALTSDVSNLVRPYAHGADRTTDPLPVIRYALSVCRELVLTARGTASYDGPTLTKVRIPSPELTQIFLNLLTNAGQALVSKGEPGGSVRISAHETKSHTEFEISDTGTGIPKQVLAKVGTPFFSTRAEGTGLGVSQSQRLVERAGGEFRIQSTEDEGTTVTFSLPRAPGKGSTP